MARTVAVVFDRDFSQRLESLAFAMPVWLVDTDANREAAEHAWLRAIEWPQLSVTLFRDPESRLTDDGWTTFLAEIELHHGAFDTLDVIGIALTPALRDASARSSFVIADESAGGFRARRTRG